jgi:hypothetical protein
MKVFVVTVPVFVSENGGCTTDGNLRVEMTMGPDATHEDAVTKLGAVLSHKLELIDFGDDT